MCVFSTSGPHLTSHHFACIFLISNPDFKKIQNQHILTSISSFSRRTSSRVEDSQRAACEESCMGRGPKEEREKKRSETQWRDEGRGCSESERSVRDVTRSCCGFSSPPRWILMSMILLLFFSFFLGVGVHFEEPLGDVQHHARHLR